MYIVFDLDDTLLNNKREVSEYTLSRLKYYQNEGHKIVINTARNIYRTIDLINLIKPDYTILDGGTIILDKDLLVIYEYPFDKITINDLILDIASFSSDVCVQTYKQLYAINPEYKYQGALFRDFNLDPIKNEENVYKIIFVPNDSEKAFALREKYNIEVFNYLNGKWFRANPALTTKYTGILALLKMTNGKEEDVIAFGDDYSDLDMITKSYHGVAMANSVPYVLEQAKHVCLSNEEDGVVKYLDDFFSKEGKK